MKYIELAKQQIPCIGFKHGNETPAVCRRKLFGENLQDCNTHCKICWKEEVSEEVKNLFQK